MQADTIILRLYELGISIQSIDGQIELRPGSVVPEELQTEVRHHKSELLSRLVPRQPLDSELTDILNRVRLRGYVLLWSTVLQDTVAFTRTFDDAKHVPIAFTVYTLDELVEVFGSETPSIGSLRLIHLAKKFGGRIVDDQ